MLSFKHHGRFEKSKGFFKRMSKLDIRSKLNKYGEEGVRALASTTPTDTGKTASSWSYNIEARDGGYAIVWNNSNVNDGVNIAIILQYGHGTGTGGYVIGRDYINPAIQPVFDAMADTIWKEVKLS